MRRAWTVEELECLSIARELQITSCTTDGLPRRPVPVWVVVFGGQVYVRTWYRRTTGWYGHALASHRAHVGVPGLQADVVIRDAGDAPSEIRSGVNSAYRRKYGRRGARRMVSLDAAATTLLLLPADNSGL